MKWYIIGYESECEVIEAPSMSHALHKAEEHADGDDFWARDFDEAMAADLGLMGYTDDDSFALPTPTAWSPL